MPVANVEHARIERSEGFGECSHRLPAEHEIRDPASDGCATTAHALSGGRSDLVTNPLGPRLKLAPDFGLRRDFIELSSPTSAPFRAIMETHSSPRSQIDEAKFDPYFPMRCNTR
jgi:hypothetical protein